MYKTCDNGYKVTGVDILKYDKSSLSHLFRNKNFEFLKLDVTKKKNISKILKNKDFIIPLAALVGAPLCEKRKKEAKKLNVDSIKLLLKKLKKNQKVIYPTTNSGYGVGEKGKYCDENSILRPISFNRRTKLKRKSNHGCGNCICFRLATVFGYSYRMRSDLLVNNFVKQQLSMKTKIFGQKLRRNYIHIDDILDAFIFQLEILKN